jgi:hypothetical protein
MCGRKQNQRTEKPREEYRTFEHYRQRQDYNITKKNYIGCVTTLILHSKAKPVLQTTVYNDTTFSGDEEDKIHTRVWPSRQVC